MRPWGREQVGSLLKAKAAWPEALCCESVPSGLAHERNTWLSPHKYQGPEDQGRETDIIEGTRDKTGCV